MSYLLKSLLDKKLAPHIKLLWIEALTELVKFTLPSIEKIPELQTVRQAFELKVLELRRCDPTNADVTIEQEFHLLFDVLIAAQLLAEKSLSHADKDLNSSDMIALEKALASSGLLDVRTYLAPLCKIENDSNEYPLVFISKNRDKINATIDKLPPPMQPPLRFMLIAQLTSFYTTEPRRVNKVDLIQQLKTFASISSAYSDRSSAPSAFTPPFFLVYRALRVVLDVNSSITFKKHELKVIANFFSEVNRLGCASEAGIAAGIILQLFNQYGDEFSSNHKIQLARIGARFLKTSYVEAATRSAGDQQFKIFSDSLALFYRHIQQNECNMIAGAFYRQVMVAHEDGIAPSMRDIDKCVQQLESEFKLNPNQAILDVLVDVEHYAKLMISMYNVALIRPETLSGFVFTPLICEELISLSQRVHAFILPLQAAQISENAEADRFELTRVALVSEMVFMNRNIISLKNQVSAFEQRLEAAEQHAGLTAVRDDTSMNMDDVVMDEHSDNIEVLANDVERLKAMVEGFSRELEQLRRPNASEPAISSSSSSSSSSSNSYRGGRFY